ncbi:MAG: InlB B-repeat-containing protein [Bacillota bacterium]
MRSKRRKMSSFPIDRRWLFGAIGLLAFIFLTVDCTVNPALVLENTVEAEQLTFQTASFELEEPLLDPEPGSGTQPERSAFLSEQLWADVSDEITNSRTTHTTPERISLNVKDANLLDVLSMLAYKLDANVIFLEEPSQITIKTEALSPITTFQIVLQKKGLDYLVIGRNYIVGERNRLYDDFTNRMFLSRYNLFYVSADNMESYINDLGIPLQSLAVDSNQKALWMQGTPMALGKARELINTLDVMENAAFAEGGSRKIRMPVAIATGQRAEEELEALIDLLSILLDGFRDGRTEMGWVTWNHPDPVPSIYMDWKSPIIRPYDIMMKITRDFNNDYGNQVRYLIAEGTPDNIELVNQMIEAIRGTGPSPLGLGITDEENDASSNNNDNNNSNSNTVQWTPTPPQGGNVQSYTVTLSGVPPEGGTLSGAGLYSEGQSVKVTASPAEGYEFVRWIENGSQMSTSQTYTFNIYSNTNLEAVFIKSSNHTESEAAKDQ